MTRREIVIGVVHLLYTTQRLTVTSSAARCSATTLTITIAEAAVAVAIFSLWTIVQAMEQRRCTGRWLA